jgi:hypothetical protein
MAEEQEAVDLRDRPSSVDRPQASKVRGEVAGFYRCEAPRSKVAIRGERCRPTLPPVPGANDRGLGPMRMLRSGRSDTSFRIVLRFRSSGHGLLDPEAVCAPAPYCGSGPGGLDVACTPRPRLMVSGPRAITSCARRRPFDAVCDRRLAGQLESQVAEAELVDRDRPGHAGSAVTVHAAIPGRAPQQ